MSNNAYSRRVAIVGYSVLTLITLAVLELASFTLIRADIGIFSKYLLVTPMKHVDEFQDYLDQRDDVLGWPSLAWKDKNTIKDGSRNSPANEKLKNKERCVSLYGDSFTFGDEVGHDLAWGNLLAKKLGCQVKNFGVSGFGTGQAVLRYERNQSDFSETVVLGLFPDDLNRIQNQWRHLLTGNNPFGFKPSFSIDEHGLMQLHKIPINSYEDYSRMLDSPDSVLTNEFYLPGQPLFLSRIEASFPYTITLARLGIKFLRSIDYAKLPGVESIRYLNYPAWYDSKNGPDIKKMQVFFGIIKHFAKNSKARQQRSIMFLIPDPEMVWDAQRGKKHTLYDDLNYMSEFVEVIDATQFLANKTSKKGVCYYYGRSRDCSGHFNKEGNELLAAYAYSQLNNKH